MINIEDIRSMPDVELELFLLGIEENDRINKARIENLEILLKTCIEKDRDNDIFLHNDT